MRLIFTFILAIGLVACAPIYSSRYHFITPNTQEGMMSVNQCLSQKSQCRQQCNATEQNCYSSIQWLKIGSAVTSAMVYNEKGQVHHRPYRELDSDYQHERWRCKSSKDSCNQECEEVYRSCYQYCGGQVHEERYCSAFCN